MSISPIKIILAVSLWCVSVVLAVGVYLWVWLNGVEQLFPEDTIFEIKKGTTLNRVAYDLNQRGAITWPTVWIVYARLSNLTNVKAGEYLLSAKNSPAELLSRFNEGKVVQHQLSFIEGKRTQDYLNKIHTEGKIKKILDYDKLIPSLDEHGIKIAHIEGWFYPDTYSFANHSTDLELLTRAHKKMQSVLSQEWENRDKDLPYKNAYEALIMASIVEKETGVPEERPEIAGVFVRRLKKGMRLQTDPTVIYGMGSAYQGNIRRRDLREPTPYNTYVIKGLPPTPIANPGREAIHAALHPKPGKTLYFVAKGDGSHYFSETLEEHNKAVSKYQKQRRSDYRSSPSEKKVKTQNER